MTFDRFGYDTDNQFRAERRFPNGTVAGYYGYVRADGKPVRVKYGAVDDLGFSAIQEIIPAAFPEQPTTESSSEESGSGAEPIQVNESPIMSDEDQKKVILLSPMEPVVDEEKESVSIDVADYYRGSSDNQPLLTASRFTYPKIDVPDLPKRRVRSAGWAPPIPVQRAAQRTVVLEKVDGEPAILYAPPTRFLTKAGVTFAIN